MNFLTFAYKNLFRRKIRTLFTVLGIGLSCWVFITLIGFNKGYQNSLNRDIEGLGFQLLLTAKGCPYESATLMLKGGTGLRYMPQEIIKDVENAPEVDKVTPMLMHAEFDPYKGENGGTTVMLGIDYKTYPAMKPYFHFQQGRWFSSDDVDEIVLGYEAAELEEREEGDIMILPNCDKEFKVVGVLERTGTQDDGMIFLPLKTLQKTFNKENLISMLGIRTDKDTDTSDFEEKLYQLPDVQVVSMAQVKNTIISLVASAKVIVLSIAAIAFLIAMFGVLNTVLMSVLERYQEIGILKAIGALPKHIFYLIWLETILLCVMGSVAGIILSYICAGVSEKLVRYFLPFAPAGNLIELSSGLILIALIFITLVGTAGGIFPALRAAFIRPLDAIRSEN